MTNWWVNEDLMFSGDGSRWYPFKTYKEATDAVLPFQEDVVVCLPGKDRPELMEFTTRR